MSKDAKYPIEPSIEKLLDIPFKEFMPGQVIQSSQFNDDMLDIEDKVNEIITKHNGVDIRLSEHQRNLLNPHCVTATQINAYEVEEVDELINDVKNGNLNDEAITNRVLADACVDNRVLVDGVVTLSKLDTNVGNQIDISNNMSIKERYTKLETDAIIQEKVGDGTYSKEQIDAKFEEYQAGTIVDGTLDVTKFKGDVGRKLDITHNPSISNRYTKSEVNTLIAKNGLPKDWGNLSDEVDDEIVTQNGLGYLPISDVMLCGEFKATETDVLNIKIQDIEFAKGEFNTLEERLDSVDLQLAHNAGEIERLENEIENEINEVIDKINNLELGDVASNLVTKEDLDKLNEELETHTHEEYITELELNNKGYLTQHQDLSHLALKTDLHSHSNKSVLDNITSAKVTEWNSKSDLSLGTTSSTAYRGDLGNKAYAHSQSAHAPSNAQKNSDITKAEIEAKLTGAITSHTHSAYSLTSHTHSNYSLTTHNHDTSYATKSELNSLSLGVHTDGMIYLFKNGQPIGDGVAQSTQSGDVVGYVDSENNIVLTGLLPNGAYKMKYQYEDGTFSNAIDVIIGDVETYKNLLPEALEEGLVGVFNGVGYKENIRWSGSRQTFVDAIKCVTTGLIPIGEYGDVFHIRGVDMVGYVSGRESGWSHYYDVNGNKLQMAVNVPSSVINTDANGDFTITLNPSIMTSIPNDAVYVRFQFGEIVGDEFIVSRNFLIP